MMDARRFDDMTRSFGHAASRRSVIRWAAAGTLTTFIGASPIGRISADAACMNRVPNPDHVPSSNGCGTASAPVTGMAGSVDITPACNRHDLCYDSCNRIKIECDETFNDQMRAICKAGHPKESQALTDCYDETNVYYRAVKFFGTAAFDAAQESACLCCPAEQVACGSVCCPAGMCFGGTCLPHLWGRGRR
jgi:hypothetical protein